MAELGDGPGAAIGSGQRLAIDLQPRFGKLKPGPGLPPEQVRADQRRRLHGATIALIDSAGWSGVRVRALARTAGVSTATFYKHFVNVDECLASTYDAVIAGVRMRAADAQGRQPNWRASLRAAVSSLMEDFAGEPRSARFALLGIFTAGPAARRRIGHGENELERLIADCFSAAPRSVPAPPRLVAAMVAGLLRVARTTAGTGRCDELPGLTTDLTDWMLALTRREMLSLMSIDHRAMRVRVRELRPFPDERLRAAHPEVVEDRERVLRTTIRLAERDGFTKLTASTIRTAAGVSRRRFDTYFDGLEDCFLEAVDLAAGEAVEQALRWSRGRRGWEQQTCDFVLALCAQAARNPARARLVFLAIFAADCTGLQRRERMLAQMAAGFQARIPTRSRPAPSVTEASVAAAWQIAQSDVVARRIRRLPLIAPLLAYVLLAPTTGAPAAVSLITEEFGATKRA